MADDAILKRIEERLTRLEGAIASQSGPSSYTPPGGAVVDPAPWGGGVVTDPAPWAGYHHWRYPFPFPHPIADPAPWAGNYSWRYPVPIPIPIPNPVGDQAPFPYAQGQAAFQAAAMARRIPVGTIGDPPPPDLSRLSIAQLEASLHTINAERARLDGMESMVKQRLGELKKG